MRIKTLKPITVVRFFVTAKTVDKETVILCYQPKENRMSVWDATSIDPTDMQDITDVSVPHSAWLKLNALLSSKKQVDPFWTNHTDDPENNRIIKSSIRVQKIKFEICSPRTRTSLPFGFDGLAQDSL